jgi:hypothetical protein
MPVSEIAAGVSGFSTTARDRTPAMQQTVCRWQPRCRFNRDADETRAFRRVNVSSY